MSEAIVTLDGWTLDGDGWWTRDGEARIAVRPVWQEGRAADWAAVMPDGTEVARGTSPHGVDAAIVEAGEALRDYIRWCE